MQTNYERNCYTNGFHYEGSQGDRTIGPHVQLTFVYQQHFLIHQKWELSSTLGQFLLQVLILKI